MGHARWPDSMSESNPVTFTLRHPEKARERTLSDDELRAIWAATQETATTLVLSGFAFLRAAGAKRSAACVGMRFCPTAF